MVLERGTRMKPTIHLLYLALIFIFPSSDGHLYFPLSYVKTSILQNEKPILIARALPAKPEVIYKIFLPDYAKSWFYLNKTTGELWLLNKIIGDKVYCMITAENLENGERAEMALYVTPDLASWKICEEFSAEDVCFWKNAQYQVYENREQTFLGELGPVFECPRLKPIYKLLNGSDYVKISRRELYSQSALDRESNRPGPFVNVSVLCYWNNDVEGRMINVSILDEDDNIPVVNGPAAAPLDIFLGTPQLQKDEVIASVTLRDGDDLMTNDYTWSILRDPLHLFHADCTVAKSKDNNQFGTSLVCKVRAAETAVFEKDSYLIILRVNDTSTVPGTGKSHVDICYNLTRSTGRKAVLLPYTLETATAYPNQVEIFVGAAIYARVAQPSWTTMVSGNPERELKEPSYRLISPPPQTSPFKITKQGGIVYVANTTRLRQYSSAMILKIQVNFPESQIKTVTVGVNIVNGDADGPCNSTSHWVNKSENQWDHCSKSLSLKSCMSMCAVGTGSSTSQSVYRRLANGCLWHGSRKPSNSYIANYSTCTPDIATCPDFNCDPLENLHKLICPQDCTKMYLPIGSKNRGLHDERGICSCDEYAKCFCISAVSTSITTVKPAIQHPRLRFRTQGGFIIQCGRECIIGIISTYFVILVSLFVIFLLCHHKHSNMTEHCLGSVLSVPDIPMEYVEGYGNPEDEEARNWKQQNVGTALDDKWEFSRGNLFFEGKIGEGEFGIVFKAQALDLNGCSGNRTVAVKTVKQNSSHQQLQDLISEFQLLKEVSHPNVIRLLGACTLPENKPIFLIIEFAEYGNLRCYLQKLRNSESGDHLPGPSTSMVLNPDVTLQDIFTFAWQISKGMAYLSEMKLVHGDLAARNILLAAGRVCKIYGFGSKRDAFIDNAYQKKSDGHVPLRWMALETLADHLFTTKSDVWSFGILLWELVTLGGTPYPGTEVHNLYNLLLEGYRMEKPFNCPNELYTIMSQCWKTDPNERQTFKEIEKSLAQVLANGVDYLNIRQVTFDSNLYLDDEDEQMDDKNNVAQYSSDDHTSASITTLLETNNGKGVAYLISELPENDQGLLSSPPSTSSSSSDKGNQPNKTEKFFIYYV